MRTFVAAVVVAAIAVVGLAAQGDVAKGQAAFADKKCGTCHKINKADEKGGKLSTILADVVGKMSADDLKAWISDPAKMEAKLPKKPVMPMSTFLKTLKPALTEGDIANLVAYVQSLPGKAPQPAPLAASR